MSEEKLNYMALLDQWTEVHVITPLQLAWNTVSHPDIARAEHELKEVIRAKVLESYRNGQAAGPSKSFKRR